MSYLVGIPENAALAANQAFNPQHTQADGLKQDIELTLSHVTLSKGHIAEHRANASRVCGDLHAALSTEEVGGLQVIQGRLAGAIKALEDETKNLREHSKAHLLLAQGMRAQTHTHTHTHIASRSARKYTSCTGLASSC